MESRYTNLIREHSRPPNTVVHHKHTMSQYSKRTMLFNKLTKTLAVRVRGPGSTARKELPVREYATEEQMHMMCRIIS